MKEIKENCTECSTDHCGVVFAEALGVLLIVAFILIVFNYAIFDLSRNIYKWWKIK